SVHVHHAEFEVPNRSRNLGAAIDRDLFAGNGINSNLAAEEEQIAAVPAEGKVEDTGIFQKELPFLREEELVRSEIKLLRVYVSIGEIGIGGEVCHEVRARTAFDVDSAGI